MTGEKKVKKPAAKKKSTTAPAKGKSGAAKKKTASQDRGRGPFYVLVILFLLTVIVFLINISYDSLPVRFNQQDQDIFKDEGKGSVIIEKKDIETAIPGSSTEETGKDEKTLNEEKAEASKTPEDRSIDIKVYFLKLNESTEQLYLSPVKRKVSDKNILTLSLETLITGPTRSEQSAGYMSAVPSSLRVNSVAIKGRSAYIDFTGAIEADAPGQILIKRLQQIVYTATGVDGVDNIYITINGRAKKSIGADGLSISGPLGRH